MHSSVTTSADLHHGREVTTASHDRCPSFNCQGIALRHYQSDCPSTGGDPGSISNPRVCFAGSAFRSSTHRPWHIQGGLWGQQLYVPQSVCEIDRAFNPGSHPSRERHQRARTSLSKQPGIPAIEGGKQYMNSINFDTNTIKNTPRTLVVLGLHDSATAVSWQ